jgi:NAD(P)-dependent dehydrogenase (short-subunit alcohol dehydrogenase family)
MTSFARRAFVCGARGGLGEALVELLLQREETEQVYATSREAASPRLLALSQRDSRLILLPMDLCREETIAAASRRVREGTERLDLLINAAGLLHREGISPEKRLADIDPVAMAELYAVNATGPLLVAKHLHDLLRHRDRAALINLSARVGSIDDNRLGGWYGYRSSKAALNMLTRGLSIELKRRAPRLVVAAVHPGTVDTDLSAPFRRSVPEENLQTPARAAGKILDLIDVLTESDSGRFFAADGAPIEW